MEQPIMDCRFESRSTGIKSQGNTGTCWSFSTTSFIETELIRSKELELDLSEMFNVRHIYKRKAEKYLRHHGGVGFSEGALAHDALYVLEHYGAVPEEVYPGKMTGRAYNHQPLYWALKHFMDSMLSIRPLPDYAYCGVDSILDIHVGPLPSLFEFDGRLYNPSSFSRDYLNFKPQDYIGLTSFLYQPAYRSFILEVPDNFSHGTYLNVPLNEFIATIDRSLELGYSIVWDGDVSELGFNSTRGFAIFNNDTAVWNLLPTLPPDLEPDEDLRQELFNRLESTDDHLMHITGICYTPEGRKFYKTKNSWGTHGSTEGYVYISEAYLRMKTISIVVPRSALRNDILEKL